MTSRAPILTLLFLGLLAAPADAGQPQAPPPAPPPPPPVVEGTAELAFVGTTGNASTNTFGVGAELIARPDGWLIRNRAAFVRNEADDAVTAESWVYGLRVERTLTTRLSAFGDYAFFRDRFAGVSSRNAALAGISWKAIERTAHHLSFDAGGGYLKERRLTGDDISSASYSGAAAYRWKLSETAEIADEAQLTGTFDDRDDWRAANALAITARLTELLSLKFSTAARYANSPAPGFRRTDTTTSIALVAKFSRPPR
jgi:putative salt-induced outer membrane protein